MSCRLSELALEYLRRAVTLETRAAQAACDARHSEAADLWAAAELCWLAKRGLDRAAEVSL